MNLKALAIRVLERNQTGNQQETKAEKVGNFPPVSDPSKFPINRSETRRNECKAYPRYGAIKGCTPEWCQKAKGAWCAGCEWLGE